MSHEYNILILGETGTGKSTTINALANYIKFESFEEAIEGNFMNLIPSKFSLPNPDPDEEESYWVTDGKDDTNEQREDGASRTQSPKGYVFRFNDRLIRVIDTPGMGDTNGLEIDKQNFKNILFYLRHHKTLQGICILLKAVDSRANAFFKYCVSELLTHLHRDACKNIVFCFTHSRSSFYQPGDGYMTLRSFLKAENIDITLKWKGEDANCYFIDNEAYRFLVAKKQGYPFNDSQIAAFKESWNKSVAQTDTMLTRIFSLEPHDIQYTTLLNSMRQLMINLAEPLVQIQKMTSKNIDNMKHLQEKCQLIQQSREEKMKNFDVKIFEVEMIPLEHPTLVCTAEKCIKIVKEDDGEHKVVYKTRCHKKCKIDGVETNVIGDPRLQKCWAFDKGESEVCKKCNCFWKLHMHLTYKFRKVMRICDPELEYDTEKMVQKFHKEYQEEYQIIEDIASKFAYILVESSNTPINRYIEPYVDLLINEEKKKINQNLNYPIAAFDNLLKMKQAHSNAIAILDASIKNKSIEKVSIKDVPRLIDQLIALQHNGGQFRKIIKTTTLHDFQKQDKEVIFTD